MYMLVIDVKLKMTSDISKIRVQQTSGGCTDSLDSLDRFRETTVHVVAILIQIFVYAVWL